ncbi:TIGR02270 family protein [Methyloprofundus sp.]|uniref:TIGR02270 family protein n=1 Tax=Methyloprofundus sp. TaxID=2020875 RepID=UPI003D0F5CFF
MFDPAKAVIPHIIDQHAEEAAFLWLLRNNAVSAPHYGLDDLAKLDDRIDAHLDGLRISGDYGWQVCRENLQIKESGEVFAAAILAMEGQSEERINLVYDIVEQAPETVNGLISAFGWVEKYNLQGKVNGLLISSNPFWRQVGISACAIHRVDPAKFLEQAIFDENLSLRARSLKAVGELGRVDLKTALLEQLNHENEQIRFWAAWSAVLVGDRGDALRTLLLEIEANSGFCLPAMQVALPALDTQSVKKTLKVLTDNKETLRMAIIGSGISGDPVYIPWLIQQMQVAEHAKVAGEAFSHLCGVDLAYQDMESEGGVEYGPTEHPDDESVEMDADEDLPYPDPVIVLKWWQDNKNSFKSDVRYLYGKPANIEQCTWVLKNGTQRLRYVATVILALMQPEQVLFETCGNGKQQKALL